MTKFSTNNTVLISDGAFFEIRKTKFKIQNIIFCYGKQEITIFVCLGVIFK